VLVLVVLAVVAQLVITRPVVEVAAAAAVVLGISSIMKQATFQPHSVGRLPRNQTAEQLVIQVRAAMVQLVRCPIAAAVSHNSNRD
jgi:hypothetical protein